VRVVADMAELDPPPPTDPREMGALLAMEEWLGSRDP
jgi:hypothetical protein